MYNAASEYNGAGEICVTNISQPFFDYFAPEARLQAGKAYSKRSAQYQKAIGSLQGWGDAFMRRIKFYTPADGHLTEEYDRNTGQAVGVADLTWSYASVLTAAFARAEMMGDKDYVKKLADRGFVPNS